MILKILTATLLFSFLSSCTHIQPVQHKTYSKEVEDEFKDIEYDQKRVLNYYRSLREKNWEEYKQGQSKNKRYQTPKRSRKPRKQKVQVRKVTPSKPPLSPEKVEELNIEIHQNLSYFCMKNRKTKKFSDKEECNTFTQNIFNECKEKYPVYRDRSAINCVKKKLK